MFALLVPSPTSARASSRATDSWCRPARGRWPHRRCRPPMTATSYVGVTRSRRSSCLATGIVRRCASTADRKLVGPVRRTSAARRSRPGLQPATASAAARPGRAPAGRPRRRRAAVACARGVDLDRELGEVGLGLHEDPRPGEPAVDPQPGQRLPEVGADERRQRPRPGRRCPPGRRGTRCPRPVDSVMPVNDAVAAESPPRRGQPGQGGHAQHAVAVGGRDGVQLGRRRR